MLQVECTCNETFINIPGFLLMGRLTIRLIPDIRQEMASKYILCTVFRGPDCDTDHHVVIAKVMGKT
jgi:hypothetical protein